MPWSLVIVTIFILFGLICYKYQDPHQNFQTAVHRIRPRAYMVLAEAWAARFWPIALILCNIQCIVPRWLQFAFHLHSLQAFCSEDISSIETANQGQCVFQSALTFCPWKEFPGCRGNLPPRRSWDLVVLYYNYTLCLCCLHAMTVLRPSPGEGESQFLCGSRAWQPHCAARQSLAPMWSSRKIWLAESFACA